jgi:hypothetical protein
MIPMKDTISPPKSHIEAITEVQPLKGFAKNSQFTTR